MKSGRCREAPEISQSSPANMLPERLAPVIRMFIHDEAMAILIESRNAEAQCLALKQA